MEEPSVLDYVKSKLAFWKQSTVTPPTANAVATANEVAAPETVAPPGEEALSMEAVAEPVAIEAASLPVDRKSFPWLVILPLALALLGQILLEPPDRLPVWSAVLYIAAAGLIMMAYLRRNVQPVLPPSGQPIPDDLSFHWEGLVIGGILMILAFLTFGAEKGEPHNFNFLNTSLWLLSIGYLVWAFYLPRPAGSWLGRARAWLARPEWKLNITRWSLLLLIVVGIVLFYRFYRLENVPAEMVSDHAEKLLDVQDVLRGELHTYFPRNTGREFFQFYWTALMIKLFNIPVSFMALKVGTVIAGLIALLYIYRLGFELGNRWVALFALAFTGVSYWANMMARIGLRFPLYPMFAAPLLFYLLRGIRTANRNDYIKAGLWLGLGLHGYTSFRIVPLVVLAAFGVYLLHEKSKELRARAVFGLILVSLISLAVFIPLLRFAVDDPDMFIFRSVTRFGERERPLPGPAPVIFAQNMWNALLMFQYDDGDVWVHSVTHRPALDIASAAVFFLGVSLLVVRYARRRHWLDLFMLFSIPLFLLPSVLSLAFPNENPNLNRTAATYISAYLILGIGLDALLQAIRRGVGGRMGVFMAGVLGLALFSWAAWQNYDLLFNQYDQSFRGYSWNATEMGQEIRAFENLTEGNGSAYVLAFPYWVDTRLVGIEAGHPDRDLAISPDVLPMTVNQPGAKLFLLKPEDVDGLKRLEGIYPEGRSWLHKSRTEGKDFVLFLVPPRESQPVSMDVTNGVE